MIKHTYAIYGMTREDDEAKLCNAVRETFPGLSLSASFHCAMLTVWLGEESTPDFDEKLLKCCADAGFSLQLPPTRTQAESDGANRQSNKKSNGVPIAVFVASLCAVLVCSILFTYTFTATSLSKQFKDQYFSNVGNTIISGTVEPEDEFTDLSILREIFDAYSVYDLDDEEMMTAILRSYVAATGDVYAVYYTAEELEALFDENAGAMVGIGVSVVNDLVPINGVEYNLLTVITSYKGGTAYEAGIQPGDIIYSLVNDEGETIYVDAVGQTRAINMIRGVEGTSVTITILRPQGKETYEPITLTLDRRSFEMYSVEYRVCYADEKIGIVEISEFDLTTPQQFKAAMDALIAQGCDKFIFDLRYNGGGDLKSIEAVLSTMLQVGDPMIYTVDKSGAEKVNVVRAVSYNDEYHTCSVAPEDIGKYRGYEMVVLTNEYTASAAELFTANLRDYQIATQIGVTTFGKGCMQSILDLSYFGVEGGLRLTTAWYLPPCKESYHDIGIAPDEKNQIALDEALFEKYNNVHLIPDEEDNQMSAAIAHLQGK